MNDLFDLELSLRRKDASHYTIDLILTQPGSDADVGPLNRQSAAAFDMVRLREVASDPTAYGQALSEMFFADPALVTAVAQCRATAQSQGVPLRLRLRIAPDAADLHALRWERLHAPDDGALLAMGEQTYFVRYLISADWQKVQRRAHGALRALVVVASPSDLAHYNLGPINVAAERDLARDGLRGITVDALETPARPTLDTIISRLHAGYDMLYLVCHGGLTEGESWLVLEDDQGRFARVPGAEFARRIGELARRPRLVVLVSCQSGSTDAAPAQNGLALHLAEAGVPAILAMQGQISVDTARMFMAKFCAELSRDGCIDRATGVARGVVRDRVDGWMPALYSRLRNGRIWYKPGFDGQSFQSWPGLLNSINKGACTPILGPGLLEPITGSSRELARRLAERHHFPLAPFARDDLPQVAQYLAVNQGVDFMLDAVDRELCRAITMCAPGAVGSLGQQAPLTDLLCAAGAAARAANPDEPHRVLASLPLPIYLTANTDPLLADALKEVGRIAHVDICPWHVAEKYKKPNNIDKPTIAAPLVYHLLGHYNDPDSHVITEDDYFRYLIGVKGNLNLIPDTVQHALADTSLLFLGFRFDDWSFRALLQSLLHLSGSGRRSRYAHVAVQIDPQDDTVIDPQAARTYLKNYFGPLAIQEHQTNISVYWGSSEDFIRELRKQWEDNQQAIAVGATRRA